MRIFFCTMFIYVFTFLSYSGNTVTAKNDNNQKRAESTLKSIYSNYSVKGSPLMRETYPFNSSYTATYLADAEQANKPNDFSYLWPYSGMFTALNTLYESSGNKKYLKSLNKSVLPGLGKYWDCTRTPCAYSSYINTAPTSDRFYDDNVWIGIDFTDTYMMTRDAQYLEKAKNVWLFIESGIDDVMGGGIYWCEQKKESKNTCSNAPGAVYALKLYEATGDAHYLNQGKALYEWTKKHLQDKSDYLYYDNIRPDGGIGMAKFAYNSGQMLQAASLLYKITKDEAYLKEAQRVAESSFQYFFEDFNAPSGQNFKLLKKGNIWFTSVMFRGFIELYGLDANRKYIDAFQANLDYAWDNARDKQGLFYTDWSGREKDNSQWLLTQAAMVEMYARMAALNH